MHSPTRGRGPRSSVTHRWRWSPPSPCSSEGSLHDAAQIGMWVVAASLNILGGLRGAAGEWHIVPEHFVERHSLFIIISLGEVLVAAGTTASGIGLDRLTAFAIIVSVAVACMWWWVYFGFLPRVMEQALRNTKGPARGRLARDVFTFGHFPLVFGLILYAVVVKHLVPHPEGTLSIDDRWLLGLSVALFVGGQVVNHWRLARRVAPERPATIVAAAVLCALGAWLPGLAVVAGIAVLLGIMQTITWRRVTR